jgi:hypothetical protein
MKAGLQLFFVENRPFIEQKFIHAFRSGETL